MKKHRKNIEKTLQYFIFLQPMCFQRFLKNTLFFQCFSNVLFFENIGKTLEKHWINIGKNIGKIIGFKYAFYQC